MFALPKMIQSFKKYGQCTYISIINGLVKKDSLIDCRQWQIICFTGLTYHNKFAPFALAYVQIKENSFQQKIKLIQNMFKLGRTPDTIITPFDVKTTYLIKQLKKRQIFNGTHYCDPLQQLEQIQKIITDPNQIKYFQDIIQSSCKQQYIQNIQKLFKNVSPTLQVRRVFNQFQQKVSKMCFHNIKTPTFIGMGFKYSANRYMSILIRYLYTHHSVCTKTKQPKPRQLYSSIKLFAGQFLKILQPQLSYIKYQTWKFQHSTNIPQMQSIRNHLKATILYPFFSQFHKAFAAYAKQRLVQDCQKNYSLKIYDVYDKLSQSIYVVAPRPQYDQNNVLKRIIWKCSCLYSSKSGLPCGHQIKITMINGTSLLQQVNYKWVQQKIGRKKAPGRPKFSRRNNCH